MKTMDEKSVLAPVLAVPAPVLAIDEEEAIEDLSATICGFQQGLGEEFALYSPGPADGGTMTAREKLQSVLAATFCTYFGRSRRRGSQTSSTRRPTSRSTWPKTTCSRTATRGQP